MGYGFIVLFNKKKSLFFSLFRDILLIKHSLIIFKISSIYFLEFNILLKVCFSISLNKYQIYVSRVIQYFKKICWKLVVCTLPLKRCLKKNWMGFWDIWRITMTFKPYTGKKKLLNLSLFIRSVLGALVLEFIGSFWQNFFHFSYSAKMLENPILFFNKATIMKTYLKINLKLAAIRWRLYYKNRKIERKIKGWKILLI